MKLILDLDQETIENMQGYCNQSNISVNKLVTDLFNNYIQSPSEIIDQEYDADHCTGFNDFSEMLTHYLNEAIYDIEESAKSEESYKTDLPMAEVFKALNRDYVKNAYVLTGLYKAFKEIDTNEND